MRCVSMDERHGSDVLVAIVKMTYAVGADWILSDGNGEHHRVNERSKVKTRSRDIGRSA